MNIEHFTNGVKINGPAVVIRKSAAVKLFGYSAELEKSDSGICPKCGNSGFNCCSYSDKVSLSKEGQELQKHSHSDPKSENNPEAKSVSENESSSTKKLSDQEKKEVEELKSRDREVRQHEQSHQAAAGHLASGGPSYTFENGPDGNKYATGGEVNIKLDQGNTPEEKLRNAQQAERAANAPAEPSSQDKQVASEARRMANEAREEINKSRQENSSTTESEKKPSDDPSTKSLIEEKTPTSPMKKASDAYKKQSIYSDNSSHNAQSTSRTLKMENIFNGLSVYA